MKVASGFLLVGSVKAQQQKQGGSEISQTSKPEYHPAALRLDR